MSTEPASPDAFLEDAAHYPGGHARGVLFPRSAADIADMLRRVPAALPVGAQSSLTGGATPMGEMIISTSKMTEVGSPSRRD
jgi:D-lactate dehydrogenase (cytochrome)